MATQTVTVSRPPTGGASKTSGLPAAGGAADYSFSDEELLGMEDAPEGGAEPREGAHEDAGEREDARNAEATPPEKQAAEDASGKKKQEQAEAPADLARLFELPEVGPKVREIYERDTQYRRLFSTVEEARAVRDLFPNTEAARTAAAARGELARLDALLESPDPRAHAELIAALKQIAPEAFRGLALTFGERLQALDPEAFERVSGTMAAQTLAVQRWPEHVALLARAAEQQDWPAVKFLAGGLAAQMEQMQRGSRGIAGGAPQAARELLPETQGQNDVRRMARQEAPRVEAQTNDAGGDARSGAGQFLEAVNSNVEQAVRQAVERKVEELLPDAPAGARQKVGGEIFRELDAALRQDPGLLDQVRDTVRGALRTGRGGNPALRGGDGSASQQEALAQLIASRARAALPGVAKRVVADWTDVVLRSSQARRAKHSEAASRVEVGRGGAPGPVGQQPKRVDYTQMSDQDILNMV
jgi:hypothetical protein